MSNRQLTLQQNTNVVWANVDAENAAHDIKKLCANGSFLKGYRPLEAGDKFPTVSEVKDALDRMQRAVDSMREAMNREDGR